MSLKHLSLNFLHTAYYLYTFFRNGSFFSSISSLAKPTHEHIFILANGPSLKKDIQPYYSLLAQHDTLMMNHAITESLYEKIKPKYYILMDSVYFVGDTYNITSKDDYKKVLKEVQSVYNALEHISYPLKLFVPNVWKYTLNIQNPHIEVKTFGITKFKGFAFIASLLFKKALALPSYCNVLIPSIICAIAMGYKHIYILGCDHDWFKNYFVNCNNKLFNNYKHFYDEDQTPCSLEKIYLHDILQIDSEILRSYHILRDIFSSTVICNLSSNSVIDAFPRSTLADILTGGGGKLRVFFLLYMTYFATLYGRAKC